MLSFRMFSFKPIETLTIPNWLDTASQADLLDRQNQSHTGFLEELSAIRNVKRIPLIQRIECLSYLMGAVYQITNAHAQTGVKLYEQIAQGSGFNNYPVRPDAFPAEFELIERLFESIAFSKHMEQCFINAQDEILTQLDTNDAWLSYKNNWPNLNGEERKDVVNLFYAAFCSYFSTPQTPITPPQFDDFKDLGALDAGQLKLDHDFNKDSLSTEVSLSTIFYSQSFPELGNTLYHEGVHLVMNHLRFFAHNAQPAEDHPIARDIKLSFDLHSKRAQPVGYITATACWHPEERLAYKAGDWFEKKLMRCT
tara:strand:+ start:176254 stop:177183 length:930 start_codon:yes stop_codon:yes gene_type:complete